VTHAFNQNQRFVSLTFQAASGGLTIQAPANANFAPPGYYMLFIVDTSGIPSVAAMVKLN
jgi:galactose oxidase